jgi:hypothetical protein
MTTLSASSTIDGSISFSEPSAGNIEYQIGTNGWNPVAAWPVTIVNTDPSANLQILFTTSITIDNNNKYFLCGSTHLQFGSRLLDELGNRTIINVTVNYDGLIQNGTQTVPGFNNIYVYNLYIEGSGYSLQLGAGWVGQKGFGNSSTNNYIINCYSSGDISSDSSGGIVGEFAGSGSGAQLYIIGCSSSGSIGSFSGGIVGKFAGQNSGSVICQGCWSEGIIVNFGGGIFGYYAGQSGTAQAIKCYSTGLISGWAGGIFGREAGDQSGYAIAEKCYSQGSIGTFGGGIFGVSAGSNSGVTSAINCYSAGTIATPGNGIYGSGKVNGIETNCYAGDGSWSSSAANTNLQGVPNPTVGTVWVSTGTNQPYELNEMGYTPYSVAVISITSELNQEFSQTIHAGQGTLSALTADASGNSFTILQIEGGNAASYSTITMSQQTGAISTTSATVPGTYTVTLRSVGSYNITRFLLNVLEQLLAGGGEISCCQVPLDLKGATYEMRYDILAGNSMIYQKETNPNFKNLSYSDVYKLKMAYAAKR